MCCVYFMNHCRAAGVAFPFRAALHFHNPRHNFIAYSMHSTKATTHCIIRHTLAQRFAFVYLLV